MLRGLNRFRPSGLYMTREDLCESSSLNRKSRGSGWKHNVEMSIDGYFLEGITSALITAKCASSCLLQQCDHQLALFLLLRALALHLLLF